MDGYFSEIEERQVALELEGDRYVSAIGEIQSCCSCNERAVSPYVFFLRRLNVLENFSLSAASMISLHLLHTPRESPVTLPNRRRSEVSSLQLSADRQRLGFHIVGIWPRGSKYTSTEDCTKSPGQR